MTENDILLRKMAKLRFSLAAETLQILLRKANFNPAQPWVPAGERDGGQWTNGGGDRSGSEWYRDTPYSQPRWRTTYSVGVVLRHDPKLPQGFLVVTAYPRSEDWEEKFMRQHVAESPGFRAFTRAMIQDRDMFHSEDELIDFGIGHVLHQHPETADDLERFLIHWLKANTTDQQLEDLWTASNADFFVIGETVRPFLSRVLERLKEQRAR